MKLTNFKQTDEKATFTLEGVNPQMLNAFRRAVISEVPVMAIEEVTFYDNSSILDDEVLAHRLGLVPLKTNLKTYNLMSECTCKGKGCGKCTVILTLDVEGPKTVYSGDIKSADPTVVPVYETIPLVKLMRGQRVKIEAKAQLGQGREHIKWQGGIASYEEKKKNTYDTLVESFGQLPVDQLMSTAFDIFQNKIDSLNSKLK